MIDADNNLILIKGEDKTASVTSWQFDKHKPIVFVTFNGQKSYPFNVFDVQFFKKPRIVSLANKIALKNDLPLSDAIQLQFFDKHCRIVYKTGYRELARSSEIRIIESALDKCESKTCFEYLKQITIKTGLVVDGHNILAKRYEKIGFVREDSVLSSFLNGKYENKCDKTDTPIIYPFGFNLSQKKSG